MNNKEIKQAVEEATAPLVKQIQELNQKIDILLGLMHQPAIPPSVKEVQSIISKIPVEVLIDIGAVGFNADPNKVWFSIPLMNGNTISVKKNEFDFRIRKRDSSGNLLNESTVSMNGLVGAIQAMA